MIELPVQQSTMINNNLHEGQDCTSKGRTQAATLSQWLSSRSNTEPQWWDRLFATLVGNEDEQRSYFCTSHSYTLGPYYSRYVLYI